jgi:SpoVK/Ycf46/Vps4 family AAA+-type ATPase
LAPSIIWIDDADKTFLKKVSKGDKTEPRRLKKELPKFVKGIGHEDRILLLGTTSSPWNFDPKVRNICLMFDVKDTLAKLEILPIY